MFESDCNPSPDVSSSLSHEPPGGNTAQKLTLAKRRANQQETETYYFTVSYCSRPENKMSQYLQGSGGRSTHIFYLKVLLITFSFQMWQSTSSLPFYSQTTLLSSAPQLARLPTLLTLMRYSLQSTFFRPTFFSTALYCRLTDLVRSWN